RRDAAARHASHHGGGRRDDRRAGRGGVKRVCARLRPNGSLFRREIVTRFRRNACACCKLVRWFVQSTAEADMRASIIGILLGTALAPAASAQTVIQRTITQEPVETTVTQTPAGTIVTRRPLGSETEAVIPRTTTREVVRRAEARPIPRTRELTTRHVSAR